MQIALDAVNRPPLLEDAAKSLKNETLEVMDNLMGQSDDNRTGKALIRKIRMERLGDPPVRTNARIKAI